MDIISIIIVIAIIKGIFGKDKEENRKQAEKFVKKAESYVKSRDVYSQQKTYTQQKNNNWQRTSAQSWHKSGMDVYGQVQQQRATKERLQQKYGSQTAAKSYAKAATQSDIVTRAKSNVKETEQDTFVQQAHAEVCAEYRGHVQDTPDLADHKGHSEECNVEGESDIIKRVNDLIVMGYSGELSFDRDFIAEGVEMLNSFSL